MTDIIAKPDHGDILIEDGKATHAFQLYLDELTTTVNANTTSLQTEITNNNASLQAQITSLTSPVTCYKYELKAANSFDEVNENSRENGTSFWIGTGTLLDDTHPSG